MIVPLTEELAQAIALGLSQRDRTEVLAMQPDTCSEDLALEVWADQILRVPDNLRSAWAVLLGGDPVVMGGVVRHPHLPHLATTWCVGSDRKMDAGVQIMRAAVEAHQAWEQRGVRKFQCLCLESPELSSRWLERLGYELEGTYRHFGRNGETFKVWGRSHGR